MTKDCNESGLRISNWTLATGTSPGERRVYSVKSLSSARRAAPDDKS
jgi:hypothetical protein